MKIRLIIPRLMSKNKTYLFIIMGILFLAHKGFYLWLQDDYLISSIKYSDISVVLSVFFTGVILIKYGLPTETKITKYMVAYIVLVLISAVTAFLIFDQSILRGIFAQRVQLSYFIFYLSVERLLEKRKIEINDIWIIIYLICWMELIICTIQYFYYMSSGVLFLRVNTGIRYNEIRFYFDPGLLLMVVFKSFVQSISIKRHRIANILFVIWTAFLLMVIMKMRAMTLAFIITLFVGILVYRKDFLKKVILIIIVIILGGTTLLKVPIVQDLISTLTNLSADANMSVRTVGRSVFLNEFIKTPITGRGYPSVSSYEAVSSLKGYLFVDNGVFGIIYSYGTLGLIWCALFWISLVKRSWQLIKINMTYFLYLLYYLAGIATDFAWFWSATCSFVVIVALMNYEYKNNIVC